MFNSGAAMPNSTIRAISGIPVAIALDAKTTALIVIDFQMEYFEGGRLLIPDGSNAMKKANRLIAFADAYDMPVCHVQHLGPAGGPLFARDRERIAFHPEIRLSARHSVIQKASASSF